MPWAEIANCNMKLKLQHVRDDKSQSLQIEQKPSDAILTSECMCRIKHYHTATIPFAHFMCHEASEHGFISICGDVWQHRLFKHYNTFLTMELNVKYRRLKQERHAHRSEIWARCKSNLNMHCHSQLINNADTKRLQSAAQLECDIWAFKCHEASGHELISICGDVWQLNVCSNITTLS